jgi:hypothetical protein
MQADREEDQIPVASADVPVASPNWGPARVGWRTAQQRQQAAPPERLDRNSQHLAGNAARQGGLRLLRSHQFR